jgi:hypothetical protein
VTATARIAFAVLVCATFAAFFVAQELKHSPPNVQDLHVTGFFSPNRDGRFDRARASFRLKRADNVTATVLDHAGDEIRVLADDRRLRAGQRMRLVWDGTDSHHHEVRDGIYRIRLNLRHQGRAVLLPRNIRKDTTPPRIVVTSIGPARAPGPELLPGADGKPAVVRFLAPVRRKAHKQIQVFRTDVQPARALFPTPVAIADDAKSWSWNGTVSGRHVAAGTYVVVVSARDRAGNIGSSVPLPLRFQYGRALPGRGGITVRYLRAQAPSTPVTAGSQASVAVESAGASFSWTLRRVGSNAIRAHGSGSRSRIVRFRVPPGRSGLDLFEVHTSTRRTAAPLVVQSQQHSDVLVVLPLTTWQGLNPVDGDGDGRPDTLSAGLPVRINQPYVKDGLPPQIRQHEALLLEQLDRGGRRYDLTTDVALAAGDGAGAAALAAHRGVVIAGDARWLDAGLARALRSYVRGGGRVLSIGTSSLRRSVTLTPGGRAIDPTLPTPRDLFGARLRMVVRSPEPVTLAGVRDTIDLFAGGAGAFGGIEAFEQTLDVPGGSQAVAAAAATEDGRRLVIVAARLGKGLVIRPGLPDFSARLHDDPELATLLDRSWTLLATR